MNTQIHSQLVSCLGSEGVKILVTFFICQTHCQYGKSLGSLQMQSLRWYNLESFPLECVLAILILHNALSLGTGKAK